MEHALLFHDSVKCTHSNEMSHVIVKTEGQLVLLASRLDEVYTGSVNYLDFLPLFSVTEHIRGLEF